jgi:FkbM family methyltransferase
MDTVLTRPPDPRAVAAYPICFSPPWHFRLAKWLIRNRIRGGFQLVELAERLKWLDLDCRYVLSGQVSVDIPLYRRVNQLALPDLLAYERDLVTILAEQISQFSAPAIWIDCGADIGILTALVAARCPRLKEAIALEANPLPWMYLDRNLSRLPFPARAICAAVADFRGKGKLAFAPHDPSDHSRFLESCAEGDLDVIRLDDLQLTPGQPVALKIDVEGGEYAVLRGAVQTLSAANGWVVAMEAHREVFRRTGVDPLECVRFLTQIGSLEARVAEHPHLQLDLAQPYFQQVKDKITNVVCIHRAQ